MTPDYSPHVEEGLPEGVPIMGHRRLERDVTGGKPNVVEVHSDELNWEAIDEMNSIQQIEDEVVLPAGRYAETVAATGFDGSHGELAIQSN
jgi:hypothetical protein